MALIEKIEAVEMDVFKTIRWMLSWLFMVKLKENENRAAKEKLYGAVIIAIGIIFFWTMYIGNIIYILRYLTKDFANALLAVFVTCALTTGTNTFIVGILFRHRLNELFAKFEEIYAESRLNIHLTVNDENMKKFFFFFLDKAKKNLLFEYLQKANKESELAGKACVYWISSFALYSCLCVVLNIIYSLIVDGYVVLRYFFPYRML